MFNSLIHWSVNNRLLVALALMLAMASAIFTIPKLKLDAVPDVTNVQVVVNTEAPGLAALEVEQLISYPIEAVMYALPDVEQVRSISKTGLSSVTIVFKESTDIYFARQLVFERLQSAKELIPAGVGLPEIGPNTSGLGQIYQYLLIADSASGYDAMALRSLNDWLVKLLLMPIDGVTDVLSFGGSVKQYQVQLDPKKLLGYQLNQQQVMAALADNNRNAGGWYLQRGQEQLVIRGTGWFSTAELGLQEIAQVPIKTHLGSVVTIADIAQVNIGQEIRQGATTMTRRTQSGEIEALGEVVSGIVLKRVGANTKATIDGIKGRISLINQALPPGVRFETFYDQADLIVQAVDTVVNALIIAFIVIAVVLTLFLANLTATLLVIVSIPVSIAMALMLMSWMNISANLMSLGGLAVAIGMLVDGSVVMVENIVNRLQQTKLSAELGAQSKHNLHLADIVKAAGQEVARPIFFASLIILVVFMPLFTFEGVEAKLFQPMAISIILAVITAVIVALVIVPALACLLLPRKMTVQRNTLLIHLESYYRRALQVAIKHTRFMITGVVCLLAVALFLLTRIGSEFVPELEEGTINLRVTLAPSSSLDTALSVAPVLEQKLLAFPEVSYAISRIGRAEIGGDPEPVNNIEILIGLTPRATWKTADTRAKLQSRFEQSLAEFPGLLFNFSQPIATRVDELLSGVKAQLAIKLFGAELAVLAEKGQEIAEVINQVAGATDVALEQITGEAQLVITPKRRQLSRYGLSVVDVMQLIQQGVGGAVAGQIVNGNERYDIYVRLAPKFRESKQAISELRIASPNGAWVRLADVATIEYQSGPPQIRRDDVQRRVVIQANVQGRAMGEVVSDIRQIIAEKVTLPAGYSVMIGGQFESQQRAQQKLMLVVPLSLTLIALLLYFAFSSISQALLILINVPLAIIGGVFSLYSFEQYLSVPSAIGFITLFGVAVLNGVVMVESINLRVKQAKAPVNAVIDGAVSRLRPVLMTALTSAFGLVPMLLSDGVGAEIQKPLACVIVGGLVTATLLTLFVLPALYPKFSQRKIAQLRNG
ncbi:cytochrome-c peroxidase [Thalassotalea insulae]|uniref:Cytochrome-c peroxidase n=1 Tax=Thalassotalea insulae TaxID=2056778 RepID=A0ABQ6GLQ1_9GAMM|nr:CusA/CzcA family heavy metal efflux RND transporter [Thalassotalea insulae]GLX76935.1 cytochrome-c peroxidase [Thalassotalea insulae]